MARTISQIQSELKAAFVAAPELITAYELDDTKTFDEQFSTVSIEAIIIYIVSYAIWTIEKMMDSFKTETDAKLEAAYITSERWYHDAALAFQQGFELVFNSSTYKVDYADTTSDNAIAAKIVKFATVKTVIPALETQRSKIQIKVSKANKAALTVDELDDFKTYMTRKGAAGIAYDITSGNAVPIAFVVEIIRDPLLLKDTTEGKAPLLAALSEYLNNLDYGGESSTTGVCDALRSVKGVKDMRYKHAIINSANNEDVRIESTTGAFVLDVDNTILTLL